MQSTDQYALTLRFRERRWLAAAGLIVFLGLVLTLGRVDNALWAYTAAHVLPFWIVHGIWLRRRFTCDPALLPIVCVLTGIGLMLMLSLSDGTLARSFVVGSAAGTLVIGAVSFIDTRRAFWSRRHVAWLAAALGIAAVLFAAGSGPAGSGARVNLDVPFVGRIQPGEALKLCLLLFMAGFFARNWRFLRELRQRPRRSPRRGEAAVHAERSALVPLRRRRRLTRFALSRFNVPRLRDVVPVTAGVAAALASCFLLRDMGPALVMGCTFLLLYGAARGRWVAAMVGFAALTGGFWAIYMTGSVPVVAERMNMLLAPWDNFVEGGEHLAHAYWAMASGGWTGVGLGSGSAAAIPAAHTDMVLPAVGEELGFVGLVALLVLYGVLLVRAIHAARRASGPFGLFLGTGIALTLLFQLFLIGGGTTGLAPLSGVVTPFVSYGKSSMLVNCALIGLLASISRTSKPARRTGRSRDRTRSRRTTPLGVAAAAVVVLLTAVGARAFFVQAVNAETWMIRPALVPRHSGERDFVYNPRVYDARRRLGMGTIRDRNGIVLAVDNARGYDAGGKAAGGIRARSEGARREGARKEEARRKAAGDDEALRAYPFGALTFYLLGDVNRRVKWGADNSLYAEHRYLSYLRGYDNHPTTVRVDGRPAVRYDYRELRPLIGPPNPEGARMLSERRDLQLTIDVRLQQGVTRVLEELAPDGSTASAVVLDVFTGDVLASATVPLPPLNTSGHVDETVFDRGYGAGAKPPGSTFKLVTAMAALNAEGARVQDWTRVVRGSDRYARRGEPTGTVDLHRALVSSSNVYFAALAREVVGPERLVSLAGVFGFRVGPPGLSPREQIDLLREPDNLRQAGFGQGPVVASPLEVAQLAAAVANGGLHRPVRWVMTSQGDGLQVPHSAGTRVLASEHARILAEAMRGVVLDRRGTAPLLRDAAIPIAGKTGTAEEDRPGKDPANHAWFAGFAPYSGAAASTTESSPGGSGSARSRRTIAVGILVEDGGHGGTVAAPIARSIIEEAAALRIIAGPTKASPSIQSTLGPTTLISRADR